MLSSLRAVPMRSERSCWQQTVTNRVGLRSSSNVTQTPIWLLLVFACHVSEVAPTTRNRCRYLTGIKAMFEQIR